jgi:SWI/SNF-related matrix-associated actin-dependent regulator 1 of chromatin subfamily A
MTLELFDYQAYAADMMAARDRFGLHDEMGIGKTATTIGTLDRIGAQRVAIIAPAMLRENWLNEFAKFQKTPRRVTKGRTIHDFIAWQRGRFDVLVTSYDQATKWAPKFVENGEFIDAIAFDEAHYLKNTDAQRTQAALGEDANGEDCWLSYACQAYHVTGTPLANDPMDIYTFLRFAKALDIPKDEFVRRFFDKRVGTYSARHTPRPEMLDTLRQLIYNNSIRRTHTDVGLQLPDIFLKELVVESNTIDIQKALEEYPHLEEIIVEAIESGNIEALEAQIAYIAVVRRLIGKAKAVAYAELLKWELDAGAGKRVVFCWHVEPLLYIKNRLAKYGYNFNVIYGATSDRDADAAVWAHENDPNTHGTILNIKKGGVGLTLVAGSEIDMLESDWTPSGNAQAIKRVHRYGQKDTVRARFITLANSFDVQVNWLVRRKTQDIAQIEGHSMTAAPLD